MTWLFSTSLRSTANNEILTGQLDARIYDWLEHVVSGLHTDLGQLLTLDRVQRLDSLIGSLEEPCGGFTHVNPHQIGLDP